MHKWSQLWEHLPLNRLNFDIRITPASQGKILWIVRPCHQGSQTLDGQIAIRLGSLGYSKPALASIEVPAPFIPGT
jgi:hypothetical protein